MSDKRSHLLTSLVNLFRRCLGLKNVLVHAKIPNSYLNVESAVVLERYSPFLQIVGHLLMNLLTSFNLGYQSPSSLCEVTHSASQEGFVPFALPIISPARPFTCANAHEYANIPSRPFVNSSFVEDLRRWIVFPSAFVNKDITAVYLYRFKGKPRRARCSAGLPDGTIERRLFSRIIRSKKNRVTVLWCAFKDSCHCTAGGRSASTYRGLKGGLEGPYVLVRFSLTS